MMLKKVAPRWFDSGFLNRPKRGLGLPLAEWLQDGGVFATEVNERFGRDLPARLGDLARGKAENLIFRLLFLDEWLRQSREP